jgi:ribulose-5-phosphate 4-epimerase/fuculose-1-phosphate aldolase
MELLTPYIDLCRCIGGMTDWVQAGGGNISIKDGDLLLLKESGVRIGDTTRVEGFVYASIKKLKECIASNNEDCSSSVLGGSGKPSIEAFFHTVPSKYVVHLHPSHLLDLLCVSNSAYVPYVKPGLKLAQEFFKLYRQEEKLYHLQNHGVIITADTIDEIFETMKSMEGWTNICLARKLFDIYKTATDTINPPIIKSFQMIPPSIIPALTPDIVLFLKQPLFLKSETSLAEDFSTYLELYKVLPNIVCDGKITYIVASSISKCYDIFELLQAVMSAHISVHTSKLTESEQLEITSWEKEKHRQSR